MVETQTWNTSKQEDKAAMMVGSIFKKLNISFTHKPKRSKLVPKVVEIL